MSSIGIVRMTRGSASRARSSRCFRKKDPRFYYTQDQIRQVIEYARDRTIRVVPEFDMPCHTTSWFVGYPQLASGKGPYQIAIHMGVLNAAMDPTKDSTYKFLNSFIEEMAGLFPDRYFHMGGDECNGKEWNANPQIQSFMHAHNIASNAALQAYFTARVQKLIAKHHKIMEGWDEVLQPETPKDVVIQILARIGLFGASGATRESRNSFYSVLSQLRFSNVSILSGRSFRRRRGYAESRAEGPHFGRGSSHVERICYA